MHYEVKTGQRTLAFDGEKIAHASSRRPDSDRWVDFSLYLTLGGSYVLERIGQTDIFHRSIGCSVVERNKLKYSSEDILEDRHVPCAECQPDEFHDILIIEKPRYFALVSDNPDAIIKSLHKRDSNDMPYMTKVAERLLEDASRNDKRIENAYRVEYIR